MFLNTVKTGELTCWFAAEARGNVLGLATMTFRSPQRSRPALGRACFLPGSVRKGVITANLQKKEADIFGILGAARRFDAECAAEGYLPSSDSSE